MEGILWLQSFRTPFLDRFFKIVTFFGDGNFYLLALPVLFWGWRKKDGLWLAFALFVILYGTSFFKSVFQVPRPEKVAVVEAAGYSFPSGHAMGSLAFFGSLALLVRRRVAWVISGTMVFLIGLSRVYLGVHYPLDVLTGWAMGGTVLAGLVPFRGRFLNILTTWNLVYLASFGAGLLAVCFVIHPEPLSPFPVSVLGALSGMLAGASLEWRQDRYQISERKWTLICNIIAGLMISILIYAGLKHILPDTAFFRFLRYFAISFWVSWGAPLAFYFLGMRRDRTTA